MLPAAKQLLRGCPGRWRAMPPLPPSLLPRPLRLLVAALADGKGGEGRAGACARHRGRLWPMLCLRGTGITRHHSRALYSTLVPSDAAFARMVGLRAGPPPMILTYAMVHSGRYVWTSKELTPCSKQVTINYKYGLPVITLTLPSRKERCQFTIKPMRMTVGDFLQDLQREDNAIEKVEVFTADGNVISTSVLMEVLLMNDFKLCMNGSEYNVHPPLKDKISTEHATEMDDIKSLVHRLFAALHLEEYQMRRERELMQKMEVLKEELLPLEQMKAGINAAVDAKTSRLLWIGLALMSTQGGALAWLTWWVYSWDIMEPVTYFITYGSAMAFYAYFVLTKQDYIYPEIRDRQFLHYFHKKSKKSRFNVDQYNKLKEDLAQVEESLKRLKNPLKLHLPIEEINDKH